MLGKCQKDVEKLRVSYRQEVARNEIIGFIVFEDVEEDVLHADRRVFVPTKKQLSIRIVKNSFKFNKILL